MYSYYEIRNGFDRIGFMNVLVVDDEELIRELIAETVQAVNPNGQVFLAEDGQRALEFFEKEELDVILTDVRMPRVGGEELVEVLSECAFKIPIIVITGYGEKDLAIRMLKMGAMDFVEKPFVGEDLENKIKEALERRRRILLEVNSYETVLKDMGLIRAKIDFYRKSANERKELIDKVTN